MKVTYAISLAALLAYATGADVSARATPDQVAHLTSVTNQLSTTYTQLTTKLNTLNADLSKKTSEISALTTQVAHQYGVMRNLTGQLNQKTKQLQDLNTFCRSQVDSLNSRVHTLETPIGFTARFNNDSVGQQFRQVGHYHYLIFDYVQYQTGGSNYNKTTGFFTAPSTGSYAFFLTVQRRDVDQNDCLEATIMKNGMSWLATAAACPTGYTSASNMAVTWLRAGDKVSIRTPHSDRVFGFVHTSFSGMKLTVH